MVQHNLHNVMCLVDALQLKDESLKIFTNINTWECIARPYTTCDRSQTVLMYLRTWNMQA